MQPINSKAIVLSGVILVLALTGCTNNPFETTDKITPRENKIEGTVQLDDGSSPDGVYVWLERLNRGSWTDRKGHFEMIFTAANQPGNALSGEAKLYYYLANYKIETARLAFFQGKVLYAHGDLNDEGVIKKPIILTKLLEVKIDVEPQQFPRNPVLDSLTMVERELIRVQLKLRSLTESVKILCPHDELGPLAVLFFKRIDSVQQFAEMRKTRGPEAIIFLADQFIGLVPQKWETSFSLEVGHLPPGNYQIIPYFSVYQDNLPEELLESLGKNVTRPIMTYLNLPMKREGGYFKVLR